MLKIFGIGNKLMGDDGIAIYVLEKIKDEILKLDPDVEVIYGETDYMYFIENINKGDWVVIVDSSLLGYHPSTVTVHELKLQKNKKILSSKHQVSLADLIMKYVEMIKVYSIAIEVSQIDFAYELSDELSEKFTQICEHVLKEIKLIVRGYQSV